METVSYHDIPHTILAALLDFDGQAGDMSPRPLMGEAAPVTKHQLAELYAGNFIKLPKDSKVTLTPLFKRVAETLNNPATNVTFRIWGADNICGETSLLFPADIIDGEGVVLNQIGQNYRIAAPVGTAEMLDLLRPIIPPGGENSIIFESHFDVPVAAVLFGLIDLVRQDKTSYFGATEIYGFLQGQWGLTGFDSLVTYVAVAGILPHPPSLQEVEFALQVLLDADMIYGNTEDQYSVVARMMPLVEGFAEVIPGVQWQRVSKGRDGELLCSNRIFIIGNDGLILSFAQTVKGRIFIAAVSRREMLDFLLDEFMITLPRPHEEKPEPPTDLTCGTCGSTVAVGRKFCTKCGASMVQKTQSKDILQETSCNSCGEKIDHNKKFCTRCGAPTG